MIKATASWSNAIILVCGNYDTSPRRIHTGILNNHIFDFFDLTEILHLDLRMTLKSFPFNPTRFISTPQIFTKRFTLGWHDRTVILMFRWNNRIHYVLVACSETSCLWVRIDPCRISQQWGEQVSETKINSMDLEIRFSRVSDLWAWYLGCKGSITSRGDIVNALGILPRLVVQRLRPKHQSERSEIHENIDKPLNLSWHNFLHPTR